MKTPDIPRAPRTPGPRMRALLYGFVRRERQLMAMWAGFGVLGLMTLAFGAAAARAEGSVAWALVYAAMASPFLLSVAVGVRKLRKARKHRRDAFVHGVPIRARITLRSQDPPALWWDFEVDGVRHASSMMVERVEDLPASLEDTAVWVLYHPKKPARSVLWLA